MTALEAVQTVQFVTIKEKRFAVIDYAVDVMAVRQRPPYDYGDLQEITRHAKSCHPR